MDGPDIFRHVEGLGPYQQQLPQTFQPPRKPLKAPPSDHGDGDFDGDASHRIAHTLTACCRCRQRKTRCDPTLPRCLPCERSGSTCEYYDTTKGKKISRYYVVRLQERVRALESELGHFTEEEDFARNNEEMIRPGGLVRLNESDETPRYLGPSSGIAMTRILMEEAKRYTDSSRISDLIPEVRIRRKGGTVSISGGPPGNRSQSFSMPPSKSRKKSYPMISAAPAHNLPSRAMTDKLVDVYRQRGQVFTPTIHERKLSHAVDAVFNGSQDPHENLIVRMIIAISMQKLDSTYAGLADSYYLAAMQYFEAAVRPKDLRTLQCLVLIGQYSLLTPTRTAVYYVVGLATRICQQLGLADEKTISLGITDHMTIDLRRRLSWTIATMEFGLAYSMGRPSAFAKSDDFMDVGFFETAKDDNITENGVLPGPPDSNKLVAIHFCKMRQCQAEIRRRLYERKQLEPKHDTHPWFAQMEAKMSQWLSSSPEDPVWCKPWFTGRYHTMIVALHRPSPQVPKPSPRSAVKCFDSAAFVINISKEQMKAAAVDITWVFLLTLYMAINTLLWSVSAYAEVRAAHHRDEVEELVNIALDMIDQCAERWPGTAAASQLYSTLAKACLQSYDSRDTPTLYSTGAFDTPPSHTDATSPPASEFSSGSTISGPQQNGPRFNAPQFGYVFDQAPEQVTFENSFSQPTFRSNSIFLNPGSNEVMQRRFSFFPPDFNQSSEHLMLDDASPPITEPTLSPPLQSPPNHLPTPPESIPQAPIGTPLLSTPRMAQASPGMLSVNPMMHPQQQPQPQRPPPPAFTIPPIPQHQQPPGQRPLPPPTTVTDWFNPPPPFISPYAFGSGVNTSFWNDAGTTNGLGVMTAGPNVFDGLPPERQGSLTLAQQDELMDVLEHDGLNDIDAYLGMGMSYGANGVGQPANMAYNGPPH